MRLNILLPMANLPMANQQGFSMIEVLVSLVIFSVGLMGLAGLHVVAQQSEVESYQRVQALILVRDMANRLNANRDVASCYVTSTALGTGYSATPACTAGTTAQNNQAVSDLTEISDTLQGAAETDSGGSNVGAMVGARGCIIFDSAISAYRVSVAWQGLGTTLAPSSGLACGQGAYPDEKLRRVVSVVVRIGNLAG